MSRTRGGRRLAAALVLVGAAVSACSAAGAAGSGPAETSVSAQDPGTSALHGMLVDGPSPRPDLVLRDTTGRAFSLAERPADEVTVVFFGYTHCPDVCPTTMADLAGARRLLSPAVRAAVNVAFITEDPERDTPEVLGEYLGRFDPSFVGLLGGNESTQATLAELFLPPTEQIPGLEGTITHPEGADHHDHGDYAVEHSAIVYVFGPSGATVVYTGGTSPVQYAEDFTRLASAA